MRMLLLIGMLCMIHGLNAQNLGLKPLHDPKMHAGCYVEDPNGEVVINLSEEDGKGHPYALIRLDDEDLSLRGIKMKSKKQIFGNDKVKIKVKSEFVRKEPGTCLEIRRFQVKVKMKTDKFSYLLDGFCGC